MLDETHDVELRCWVASAHLEGTDFPIQNLPLGIFRRKDAAENFRGGIAIGNQILDLAAALETGAFDASAVGALAARAIECAARDSLNELMGMGRESARALRLAASRALRVNARQQEVLAACLVAQADAEFGVPARIGDYTDFYSSVHHATAIGKLMRPDNPLLPNYKWVPIAYHGRCSSIGVSGQVFPRPKGQRLAPGSTTPTVGPSQRLDYELEIGAFVGAGNAEGTSISMTEAESHIFGLCLLNDWSARDVQTWEYQPLGPFLAKNFATTLSPWVVTLDALAPFRAAWSRPSEDPQPLGYLSSEINAQSGAFDIGLEVFIETPQMRATASPPYRLARSNFKYSYWTLAQMVAHHTINGCNLRQGDLLGSGTQSGPTPEEAGSLLELTNGGKQAIKLPTGEERTFVRDGDSIIFRGACRRPGCASIGFGESISQVIESTAQPT